MSFDLAFWVGPRPASDEAAAEEFQRLHDTHADGASGAAPHPALVAFVAEVLTRYPELSGDDDDTLWASSPLADEITGPLLYVPLAGSRAEEGTAYLAERARAHQLVGFDPQSGTLLPSAAPAARRGGLSLTSCSAR